MRSYLSGVAGTRATPQSEPMTPEQVENSAGGYAWEVGPLDRLRRFLILGSEGGSYYASQRDLTKQNVGAVRAALDQLGAKAVAEIVAVSVEGRAPKTDPALFALAMAAGHREDAVRKAALDALPQVCRTGTHLFHFAAFVEEFRGWGRALRRAVAGWYEREDLDALAYQLVKYRQRDGWSHRDLLRLSHPKPPTIAHDALYAWATGKSVRTEAEPEAVVAFIHAQEAATPKDTAALIEDFGGKLPREALNPDHLTAPEVWDALLEHMPMTALIRNLATMTRAGILTPMSEGERRVLDALGNEDRILKARVHPITVLSALATYAKGHGARSGNEWAANPRIVDALDGAFYAAFGNVRPVGKRWLLALDVSGSMGWGEIAGVPGLTPRVASAAMALVTAKTEPSYTALAFATQLTQMPLSSRQRLDDVLAMTGALPMGGTDCALPMLAARDNGIEVDVFVVYTDSETWAGSIHPAQALRAYREKSGIDAKLIVVGMMANDFTIADPQDRGMLDVVGFDTAAPNVMGDFAAGRL